MCRGLGAPLARGGSRGFAWAWLPFKPSATFSKVDRGAEGQGRRQLALEFVRDLHDYGHEQAVGGASTDGEDHRRFLWEGTPSTVNLVTISKMTSCRSHVDVLCVCVSGTQQRRAGRARVRPLRCVLCARVRGGPHTHVSLEDSREARGIPRSQDTEVGCRDENLAKFQRDFLSVSMFYVNGRDLYSNAPIFNSSLICFIEQQVFRRIKSHGGVSSARHFIFDYISLRQETSRPRP